MESWIGWMFAAMFFSLYVFCIVTVCVLTFQKGRWVMGVLGIFLPILWLIGAVLPAKKDHATKARPRDGLRTAGRAVHGVRHTLPRAGRSVQHT